MGLVENEQLVETFVADRSDPALGVSIGVGSGYWPVDDMATLGDKDCVECLGELRIIVVDQEANTRCASLEAPDNLARLLVNPG